MKSHWQTELNKLNKTLSALQEKHSRNKPLTVEMLNQNLSAAASSGGNKKKYTLRKRTKKHKKSNKKTTRKSSK